MSPLTAVVLAVGVRLVDAVVPGPDPARAPDDPREIRDRVLRAAALTAVLLLARRASARRTA